MASVVVLCKNRLYTDMRARSIRAKSATDVNQTFCFFFTNLFIYF